MCVWWAWAALAPGPFGSCCASSEMTMSPAHLGAGLLPTLAERALQLALLAF